MTPVALIGLTLAFLAPMPAERPEPPKPLPGNAWAATLIMVGIIFLMVMPMFTIWGFYRPEETFRARCHAQGGHAVFAALDGSGPRRCAPNRTAPAAPPG